MLIYLSVFRGALQNNPKLSNIWIAKITRKEIYDDLSSYRFNSKNWEVPIEIINSSDKKIIGSFLRGFYDSEGSVLKGPRSFSVSVCSTNKKGLEEIQDLLKKLGISTTNFMIDKRHKNNVFNFAILKKENLEIFLNEVGFAIRRKQNKLIEHLK